MQTMSEFTSISDSLALMADPALQQFAQMHKDDPFSLALAVSESNRRKKLRAAQQGVAGMQQQQPPVADQEIAQMNAPVMPENVGIGALPAPSMAGMPMGGITGEEEMEPQTMAGGGMVAFRDGGDVERYQSRGLVQDAARYAASDVESEAERARRLVRMAQARAAFSGRMPFTYGLTPGAAAAGLGVAGIPIGIAGGLTSAMEAMRAEGYPVDPRGEFATEATPEEMAFDEARRQREAVVSSTPAKAAVSQSGPRISPAMVFPSAAEQLRLAAAGEEVPVASAAAPGAGRGPAAPPRPAAAAAPRPAAAAVPGIGGLDAAAEYEKALKAAEAKPDPNAADVKALGEERVKVGQESVTGLEAIQKQFSDIFKGRKERLDTREAEVGKLKDQGLGLALLQAGAAMMTTRGGLGVALGKGVQVGTEQYASGLEKLRSAQEKIADARDRLEEIEAQRGELSARELFKARNEVKNLGINAREDLIKSRMLSTKENRETAMKVVDSTLRLAGTREEITGRKDVAAITAAAYRDTAGARGDSGQNKAMAVLLETTRKNIEAEAVKKFPYPTGNEREQYVKNALRTAIQSSPALAQYVGATGGGGAPSGADLRFDEKTGQFVPMR